MTVKAWMPRNMQGWYVGLDLLDRNQINFVDVKICSEDKHISISETPSLANKASEVWISFEMLDLIFEAKNNLLKAEENADKLKEANNGEVWG